MKKLLFVTLFIATNCIFTPSLLQATTPPQIDDSNARELPTEQEIQQRVRETAKNITVRITSENNGGSGVIIAQKGNTYLILTNAHVVRRATQIQVQAPDGRKYTARKVDGGFSPNYDLALLEISSNSKYQLADLSISSIQIEVNNQDIYSTGFPFDSNDLRITSGQISQLSDIPFDDGTQIGYTIDAGKKGIRQGMSGGPIFNGSGALIGINTVGVAPILPDYTYNDGSKPLPKLVTKYRQANWGIPVYNFLTNVKADILYGYDNLPKVERQVTPTGYYLAKLNNRARQMTVRIENSGGNGSGVIVAREGSSYYVLTAKHVMQNLENQQKYTNHQIITYDQDRHSATSTIVAEGVDLAIVKFSSNSNYPLARLGEYSPNNRDLVFVGGFPERGTINSPLWQWQLNPGLVSDREQGKLNTQDNQSFSEGYDLIYSSISYGGMSGGPVFDTAGNVIGIHGKAEGTDADKEIDKGTVILGNSLGISIQTFVGLAAKSQLSPQLLTITKTSPVELNPEERNNVIIAMQSITQPQAEDDGKRWLAYGNQLYRTYQFDKSVAAFDRAISKGEVLLGSYGKALSLGETGKYPLAETAIAQAIAAIPSSERATYYYFWKRQSFILRNLEKYDEALKAIDIAISLANNDLTLLNEKGRIFSSKKQYVEAISIYDEIIRKQPEVYAYIHRGLAKSDLGDKQAAIADYDRAIVLNSKDAKAYYNRGVAKYVLRNKQAAITDYDQAIAINPKDAKAYYNRGLAKSDLGNKQAAIADYDRAIVLNPKLAEAYGNRGAAKYVLGNKQAAIADYDRAIVLNPKLAEAYGNRGAAKSDLGNKQAAIADYDRAIAINPKLAEVYFNRGLAKSGLGDKQSAIADYDRAIAINPKLAEAYGNRGNAKYVLGDKQGGITDMSKAAELFRQQGRMNDYQKAMDLLKKWQGN